MEVLQILRDNLFHRLKLKQDQLLFVSWSGGADSTALVHGLRLLNHPFKAVYFQHGQRGEESRAEEQWIVKQAQIWKFEVEVIDLQEQLRQLHGTSFQERARMLRRTNLRNVSMESPIATAHHLDDAWETVVFRLTHGGNATTFAPLLWEKDGFVKPFLNLQKQDLIDFLAENGLDYLTDSSNSSTKYGRNRLRKEVLPVLNAFNSLSYRSKEQALARWRVARFRLDGQLPLFVPKSKELAHAFVANWQDPEVAVEEWLDAKSCDAWGLWKSREKVGTCFYSNENIAVWIEREVFVQVAHQEMPKEHLLHAGQIRLDFGQGEVHVEERFIQLVELQHLQSHQAALDLSTLQFPLVLRPWKEGDQFVPLGMKGKQNISDYLTNHKVPPHKRKDQWVLCSGDQVVWLVGHRISELHKVVEETEMVYLAQLFIKP